MRVLIVDDEVIIRNGLSTVIQWEELGFSLLLPADSAEEALSRIPSEQPHIILTDIRMTGKSGLELADEVKHAYPDTELIVLSGYDDFLYVQNAFRKGVGDYLLKTSRPEEIIKAVLKAKQRLLHRWENQKQDHIKQTIFRNKMLERLINGDISDPDQWLEIQQLCPQLRLEAPNQSFQVLIVSAIGWGESLSYNSSLLHFAMENVLSELLQCEKIRWKDRVVLILNHPSHPEVSPNRLKSEISLVEDKLKCSIFAAVGTSVGSIQDVPRSFAEAAYAFSFKSIVGEKGFVSYPDVKERKGTRTVCSHEEESELAAILKNGDLVELRHWIGDMIRRLASEPEATPISVNAYLQSVMIAGYRWLERAAASIGLVHHLPDRLVPEAVEIEGLTENSVFKYLNAVVEVYKRTFNEEKMSYIQKAIAYICDNLEKNITLQQVAGHVHINPNHFSEMFKRESGWNYIEFVTRERMRRAMEILNETPAKVSEVAKQVGYEDVKYFSQLFKKHIGKTPTEYRGKS